MKPLVGTAVNATVAAASKLAAHDRAQSIPPGCEVTVPAPLTLIRSSCVVPVDLSLSNDADTVWSPLRSTSHATLAEHAFPQPEKCEPGAAAATRV